MSNLIKIATTVATIVGVGVVSARLLNGLSASSLERKAEQDLSTNTGRKDLKVTIKPAWFGNRWSVVVTDAAGKVVHSDTLALETIGFYYRWPTYGAWLLLVRDTLKGEQV